MSALTIGELRIVLKVVNEAGPQLKQAIGQVTQFKSQMQTIGREVSNAGAAITKMAAPLALMGGAALRAAIQFESGFAGVKKTVDATDAEFRQLSDGFRRLATQMPITAVELTKVGEAAGQLGIKKQNILAFTETMAKMGATTNLTADEAAVAMARFTNIMGTPQTAVNELGAAIVALGNDGASTEREIVDMALRIAGAGKTIGLTEGEVLGLANALSSVGIEAEQGGSAISRVMVNIAVAVEEGGSAVSEFANVARMSNAEFSKLFSTNSGAAMAAFISGLTKIKAEGGSLLGTLKDLEINEIRLRDTLLRVGNANGLVTESMALGNKAMREGSALNVEYQKRLETTESQLRLLWNSIGEVAIKLGEVLKPALRAVMDVLRDALPHLEKAVQWFGNLPKPVQVSAIAAGALFVALGPLVFIIGQLITSVGTIATAFVTLAGATAMGAVTSGASGVIAALRNIGVAAATSRAMVLGLGAGLAGLGIGAAAAFVGNQRDQLGRDLASASGAGRGGRIGGGGPMTIDEARAQLGNAGAAVWEAVLPALGGGSPSRGGAGGRTGSASGSGGDSGDGSISPIVSVLNRLGLSQLQVPNRERFITQLPTLLGGRSIAKIGEIGPASLAGTSAVPGPGFFARMNLGSMLPQTIMAALAGGGSVGRSVGGLLGGSAVSSLLSGGAGKAISGALSGALGKTLGGAIGSVIPGLGTMVGSMIGPLVGKLFGKSEESSKVSPLRDEFFKMAGGLEVLNPKVMQLTGSLQLVENIFRAKTAEQYNAAMTALKDTLAFQDQAMQTLTATAQKYGFTLEELGPALSRAELDKKAQELYQDWQVLVSGGIDIQNVITRMSESVSAFVQRAMAMGLEVPNAMRPMLEQMAASGQLLDANGKAITNLEDAGISFAMTMSEGFQSLIGEVQKLTDAISRGLGLAIQNVPDAEFTVRGRYELPDEFPREFPEFASGTRGRYLDFGGGTPVVLHNRERVMTEAEGRADAMSTAALEEEVRGLRQDFKRLPYVLVSTWQDAQVHS